MNRLTFFRMIAAAVFVAASLLSMGPARAANVKDITLVLTNRTDTHIRVIFRTLSGKNEPEFAIARGSSLTVTFEGQYQLGGIIPTGRNVFIRPREIKLTRGAAQTMSVEYDRAEGEYYFQ